MADIRGSYNKKRTPKWARQVRRFTIVNTQSPAYSLPHSLRSLAQLGLIDESEFERKKKKSQWAGRYNERNTESTMVGAPLAEGEEGDNYEPAPVLDEEEERRRVKGDLWRRGEEEYYGELRGRAGGRAGERGKESARSRSERRSG